MTYEQRLQQNFCFCQSGDRYDTDPGGQTTYHDGHKIVFSLWRKWIREAATGGVLRNFARPATLLKKRLWHRCFPVGFAIFLRTPFLQNTSGPLLLQLELWNIEFWRLKKLLWKPYKSDYIQSLQTCPLNMYKKKKKEKKFDSKRKRTFFYLNFSWIATLKNEDNNFLYQLCFLSLYLLWLTACIFDFFCLRITSQSWLVTVKHYES